MSTESSFEGLMQQLREGDPRAAARVFHEYSRRLAGLARQRLQGPMAAKVDPDDVLQSVFRSFFVRQRDGEFELDGWESLWSLLTVITLRKCGRQVAYFQAQCRSVRREVAPPPASSDDSYASCVAIARDPTPQESAMLIETVEQILQELSGRDRRIVEATLQGKTPAEISEGERCSERTVERVRARLLARLESLCQGE